MVVRAIHVGCCFFLTDDVANSDPEAFRPELIAYHIITVQAALRPGDGEYYMKVSSPVHCRPSKQILLVTNKANDS